MPYEKSLDVELFKETKEFEDTRITIGIFSYNGNEKKLQVTRENLDASEGGWRFTKLGRLTKTEVKEIVPILMKAVDTM